MKKLLIVVIGIYAVLPTMTIATITQTGRYLVVDHKNTAEASDLLAQVRQVRFSDDVKTIEEGIKQLLKYSGYALTEQETWKNEQMILMKQPLPLIQRTIGPATLRELLQLLAGSAFNVIEDPLHRTITFNILPEYQLVDETTDTQDTEIAQKDDNNEIIYADNQE